MRKITVFVPAKLLASAQDYTAKGVSETVREGLERLARQHSNELLLALRGKVKFDVSLDALREDREFDEHGNVR
ncbi:MAG TPA: hypothetical protein VGL58_07670 [Caulobacteraceae bacterium]